MKEYTQLTQPQKYEISALHKVGQGPTQIARIVGVHRTTISRELKRNQSPNGYYILKRLINVAKNGEQTVFAHSSGPDAVAVWSKANCVTSGAPSRWPVG
ncbi:MAG: helix-turn-helix domain-containing protein [Gemmatimonadetes bacterium]|jgi:IS30 family transposase|nr:helix-turn-helix domain-containing protein [Gemmatimonadota bacterium]